MNPELKASMRTNKILPYKHLTVPCADDDVLIRTIRNAILSYEEILTEKNGRKTRATHTWSSIVRHGWIEAVSRSVLSKNDPMGFKELDEAGKSSISYESIVLGFPEYFSKEVVDVSRRKLAKPEGKGQ